MAQKPTVLVAMSGGVDSSVALALLRDEGHEVLGVTLRLVPEPAEASVFEPCCSLAGVEDARRVAARLEVPHRVVHMTDRFERDVIDDFVREYQAGRTPNPCVRCNLDIKFGALLDMAGRFGADRVATGHYVRRERRAGRVALRRAVHRPKDQSYVLAGLSQEQLASALFPLGGLAKAEVRERARALGLPTADKPESQEICFVPNDDYRAFLAQRVGLPAAGPILSTSGAGLGEHKGLLHYTIGQRKGLGIAAPRPYYVVRLDVARNAVIVGHEEDTYCAGLVARAVNWCSIAAQTAPFDCLAQLRYRHTAAPATATPDGEGLAVQFHRPERGVTPGQWVVLYDAEEYVLAAGIIDSFDVYRAS